MDEQMALLEGYGLAQRDCVGSTWYADHSHLGAGDRGVLNVRTDAAVEACTATRRLVEEVRETAGLYRRYRCVVEGHDVEMSYTIRRGPDHGSGYWCEYAVSGDRPFQPSERYTEFREVGPL